MIRTRPAFISALEEKLQHQPLPGLEAQLRMAHALRKAETISTATSRDAGVLITLFENGPDDWQVILIKRTGDQKSDKHAGQIAFPGGKWEQGDRDLLYTALREAEEEVSLDLTKIDILGNLTPLFITVSQFLVHPWLAFSWEIPSLKPQIREIEEILTLPLAAFQHTENRTQTRIALGNGIVLNHVPAFQIQGHVIWGATAMIMSELLVLLEEHTA